MPFILNMCERGQTREAIKGVEKAVSIHKWQVNRDIFMRYFLNLFSVYCNIYRFSEIKEITDTDLTTLGPHVSIHLSQMKKLFFDFGWYIFLSSIFDILIVIILGAD